MDPRIFQQALKATARVACASILLGAAGTALADAGPADAGARVPAPSQVAPVPVQAEAPRAEDAARPAPLTATPGNIACQIAYHFGVIPTGCTPWGPPVPPRMPEGDDVGVA